VRRFFGAGRSSKRSSISEEKASVATEEEDDFDDDHENERERGGSIQEQKLNLGIRSQVMPDVPQSGGEVARDMVHTTRHKLHASFMSIAVHVLNPSF
jgi:hypothetical protein